MTDHRLLVFLEELQRHPIDLAAFLAERVGRMKSPLAEGAARGADRGDVA